MGVYCTTETINVALQESKQTTQADNVTVGCAEKGSLLSCSCYKPSRSRHSSCGVVTSDSDGCTVSAGEQLLDDDLIENGVQVVCADDATSGERFREAISSA